MKRFLLFLLLPISAFAQQGGVFIPARTVFGTVNGITRPISGATITVCAANTSGIPCSPALSNAVFKDSGLTVPLSNPFLADSQGNYPQAAIAGGTYTITESAPGFAGFSYQATVSCAPGAPCSVTGALTVSGALSIGSIAKINNVILVDGATYTGPQALQTAIQACAGLTACVVDARNPLIGTQTFTTDPFSALNMPIQLDTAGYTIQWDHAALNVNVPSGLHWTMHGTTLLNSTASTGNSLTPNSGAFDNSVMEMKPFLAAKLYTTTGAITSGTSTVTVASATGITVGAMLGILGANGSTANQATTINQGGGIGTGDASFTVTSTTGWFTSNNNYIKIDSEVLKCSSGTATTFATCTRGQLGTTAATHANAAAVQAVPVFLSEIIGVSGTTITLRDNATVTVSSAPVFVGSSNIVLDGNGTLNGNQVGASSLTFLMGFLVAFSGNVTVGPGIRIKNFDQVGVQLAASKHCNIYSSYQGIGKPPNNQGWDVGIFEMAAENNVITGYHLTTDGSGTNGGDIGLFIDDRSTDFTYISGPVLDNTVKMATIRNYTQCAIIQSGSSRNRVDIGSCKITGNANSNGITINQDNDWIGAVTAPKPTSNVIYFQSVDATGGNASMTSFNFTAGNNLILGGNLIGGPAPVIASGDTLMWQNGSGQLQFLGTPINSFTFARSGGASGFPDVAGNGTNAIVIGDANGERLDGPILTNSNCKVNSVSPAACTSSAAGSFVVPTTTTTYTVNTTRVTANSQINLFPRTDNSSLPSAPTCVAPAAGFVGVSGRTAGTSFTIALPSTTGTTCFDYEIIN